MKNSIFSRRAGLILAALFVVSFAFFGCKPDAPVNTLPAGIVELSENDTLVGKWVASEYESYEITATTFKSGYEGNNLVVGYTNDAKTEGYIYIKYTKAIESTTTEPTGDDKATWTDWGNNYWSRYSTTAPDAGKWYAIAFKDLTATTIQISGAYGTKSSTATLEEAIAEFTIENKYFGMYSACTKQ
ncbi:MAG: hypothetical protein K6A43_08285 [Treponema sp.]|nr:hypothetical protein [Treponema sp.]